jgi:hypothetical protein
MAKETVKEEKRTEPVGRECAEVQLGQSIQIGPVPITHINAHHEPIARRLQSKLILTENGVEFMFDGKECLVPTGVIKLIVFA